MTNSTLDIAKIREQWKGMPRDAIINRFDDEDGSISYQLQTNDDNAIVLFEINDFLLDGAKEVIETLADAFHTIPALLDKIESQQRMIEEAKEFTSRYIW